MQEQGGAILLEDSNEFMTNRGADFLLGEESINGTEKGSGVCQLSYSLVVNAMTNIDATMVLLKEIVLLLKNVSVQADVEIPSMR